MEFVLGFGTKAVDDRPDGSNASTGPFPAMNSTLAAGEKAYVELSVDNMDSKVFGG